MQVSDRSCSGREEELATFIDGGLSPEERASLVRHLESCETCYRIYVETRRFLAEMSESAGLKEAEVVAEDALLRPGVWRRLRWALPPAAAVLIGVGLFTVFPRTGDQQALDSASLTASFEDRLVQIETDWTEPLWSSDRSYGGSEVELETLFMLGARIVDLDLALKMQDRATSQEIVTAVRMLVEATSRPELARSYRDIGEQLAEVRTPVTLLNSVRSAEDAIDAYLARPAYQLGKWTRAAYLAALCGDTAFFSKYGDTSRLVALYSRLPDQYSEEWKRIFSLLQRPVDTASLRTLLELLDGVLRRGRP